MNMQQRLQAYYESRFPARPGVQIGNLVSITNGWEHEMYSFELTDGPIGNRRREALVLRIYDGDNAHETSVREFYGMQRLYEVGYPVPRVDILEPTKSAMGKPFVIMERIEGQLYGTLIVKAPEDKARELRTLFCRLLLQLHRLDWRRFAEYSMNYETHGAYTFVDYYLADERATLERDSLSGFLPVVEWLRQRRNEVPCERPSVVHCDFHVNNILIREDGSPVVIDWARLHVSDARLDLACTLIAVQSYVGVERRNYLLREYERQAGATIEHLAWFEVLACLWRLRTVVVLLAGGAEKIGFHAASAQIAEREKDAMKRVYEFLLEKTAVRVPEVEKLFS